MRLRQFTPRQPVPDVQITPREWKTDQEVIFEHDNLYARAWECENEISIFQSDYINLVTPNSQEFTVRSEEVADEMSSTPETTRENSPQICPQTDRSCDGTDTDHYKQPDVDVSAEKSDTSTDNSCVASLEKRSVRATATRRKVSFSYARKKAHKSTQRSSNSKLYKW